MSARRSICCGFVRAQVSATCAPSDQPATKHFRRRTYGDVVRESLERIRLACGAAAIAGQIVREDLVAGRQPLGELVEHGAIHAPPMQQHHRRHDA